MNIGVIGAGNWGTALAALLSEKGYKTTLWAYEKEVADAINSNHKNPLFLIDFSLPKELKATNNIEEAVSKKDFVVFVVPSEVARITASKMAPFISPSTIFISCTKGIENETGELISDILKETIPSLKEENFCYLSGPSFAKEVAKKQPTTVVIAGKNLETAKKGQDLFRTDYFMAFTNNDIVGIQVGGAVKNIIAIACGISDGLGFGHNTRAATITRGLYEMIKIGKALGANPLTFAGLSGIGDLILTCTSELSRNRYVGFELGTGKNLSEIKKGMKQIAEGVATSKAIHLLSEKLNISTPICSEVYKMLYEGKSPKDVVSDLTKMELREELRSIL